MTWARELALDEDSAAATYVYAIPGDCTGFLRAINRAMEAIAFHREVISLPDDQLRAAGRNDYVMAVRRTAAARLLRQSLEAV